MVEPCKHEPVIVHRSGGISAEEKNFCGNCGKVIYRLAGDAWTIHPLGSDGAKLDARMAALDVALNGRKPEQARLPLANPQPAENAACAKCGRAFTAPSQYRYRGVDGKPICRNERECRIRAEIRS